MLSTKIKYCYNDIMIKPSALSYICHRAECNPYLEDGNFPIFTAPMSAVVDEKSYDTFKENHIIPILPRNIGLDKRLHNTLNGGWSAYSLNEFVENFSDETNSLVMKTDDTMGEVKVLIDVANGHMEQLYRLVRDTKRWVRKTDKKIVVMLGNIANPYTYRIAAESEVDYIRCSIGSGQGCLSSSNLGIHYPIASLIAEISEIREDMVFKGAEKSKLPKIIADGGVRNYSDIIKALALGADYVMCGGIFAQLKDSAGKLVFDKNDHICKQFYGMASKEGQIDLNGEKTKTSEGVCKLLPIKGDIKQWSENMRDYFRSAMSYCNIKDIRDFNPNKVDCVVISENTKESINK